MDALSQGLLELELVASLRLVAARRLCLRPTSLERLAAFFLAGLHFMLVLSQVGAPCLCRLLDRNNLGRVILPMVRRSDPGDFRPLPPVACRGTFLPRAQKQLARLGYGRSCGNSTHL